MVNGITLEAVSKDADDQIKAIRTQTLKIKQKMSTQQPEKRAATEC